MFKEKGPFHVVFPIEFDCNNITFLQDQIDIKKLKIKIKIKENKGMMNHKFGTRMTIFHIK